MPCQGRTRLVLVKWDGRVLLPGALDEHPQAGGSRRRGHGRGERNLGTTLTLWLPWKLRGAHPVTVIGQRVAPHEPALREMKTLFTSDLSDLERCRPTSFAGKLGLKVLWCLKRQLQTFMKWFSGFITRNQNSLLGQCHQSFGRSKVCALKT